MGNSKSVLLRYPKNTYHTLCQLLNQEADLKTSYSEFLESNNVKQTISSIESLVPEKPSGQSSLENTVKFALSGIAVSEAFSKLVASIGLLISSIISDIACVLINFIVGAELLAGKILNQAALFLYEYCPESVSNRIKSISEQYDQLSYMCLCLLVCWITGYSLLIQCVINSYFDLISSIASSAIAAICLIVGGLVGVIVDALMLYTTLPARTARFVETISSIAGKPLEKLSEITRKPLAALSDNASNTCNFWFPKTGNNRSSFTKDLMFLSENDGMKFLNKIHRSVLRSN